MAFKSQGTTLHISNEDADVTAYGTATFVKVSETASIGEPDGEAADIDVTHLESVEEESLSGIPRNGSIAVSGFASRDDDAGQAEMHAARLAQERRWIKITLSTGAVRYFKGTVKKFADFSAAVDGAVPFNGTIKIAGVVTRVDAP
ncbi:hypothetical protein BH10PSE12_BH10PSE12_02700 [soil metagenome]